MEKLLLGKIGKIYINRKNNQTKFELKKRVLKDKGIKIEDLMKVDISKLIKHKNKTTKFEDDFESKWSV